MKKQILSKYFDKLSLKGIMTRAKFNVNEIEIKAESISENKDLLVIIENTNYNYLNKSEFVLFSMSKIIKLTKLFEEKVTLEIEYSGGSPLKLIVFENDLKGVMTLADPILSPNIPKLIDLDFHYKIEFDIEFFNKLKKVSSSSIETTDDMTLSITNDENDEGCLYFIIGDRASYSDKLILKYPLDTKIENSLEFTFPLTYFSNICSVNSNFSKGTLYINNEGLIKFYFSELLINDDDPENIKDIIQNSQYILIPQA